MGNNKAYSFETKTDVPTRLIRQITRLLTYSLIQQCSITTMSNQAYSFKTKTDAPPRMTGLFNLLFDTTMSNNNE